MLEKIKKLKIIFIYFTAIMCFLLVISLLNLVNLLGGTASAVISMLFGVILFASAGYIRGKKREKNGYVAGLITGVVLIAIIFLISFLFMKTKINLAMVIYYSILLISCILGSIVGINKKKNNS